MSAPTASIPASGFCAGTLVHTKNGLVPIEQVKVGDWVLSKPRNGEGPKAYKRVTRTLVQDSQEVWLIEYSSPGERQLRALVATMTHPFRVADQGWSPVSELRSGDYLELSDSENGSHLAIVVRAMRVAATGTHDVGWAGGTRDNDGNDWELGPAVDLRVGNVHVSQPGDYFFNRAAMDLEEALLCQVFNWEVEDFHTYYVGEHGIWVHDSLPPSGLRAESLTKPETGA